MKQMFVSRCGHFVLNELKPNATDIIRLNEKHTYLTCYDWRVHQLVGSAWVYNPCPNYFTVLDHINNEKQDNRAENLRWVSQHLNTLNRTRTEWVKYRARWKKYEGRVEVNGKTERVWDKCATEAKRKTKELLINRFNDVYERTLEVDEGDPPARAAHDFYWKDPAKRTPGRYSLNDIGNCWVDSNRSAKLCV
jgi:hypothetical protein